jgi:hypothetical protein
MTQHTPLYIIASPRPRVGKTLIARLLIEFFRTSDRPVVGYDLNLREPMLAGRFPRLVRTIDIADTRGQMQLFDRLIVDDLNTKVIDLGYGAFEQFFAVMDEIGFGQEARRRRVEPIVLFVSDPAAATVRAYGELRRRLAQTVFVPVHNESVAVTFEEKDFPPTRAQYRFIRIPRLSPMVRGVLDRPSFSVSRHVIDRDRGATEIHDWIGSIFNEFRELELRLLMGKLSSELRRAPRRTRELHRGR